ncbi:MAG: glycosyl transferase family 1 [Acidimicrobiales bacterium]|nr:glycosyl transferase family 1 [Acidimicrobiales bacterium]
MRIAVIAPPSVPVPPPAYGGTEMVIDGLCRGLTRRGHDVLLCTTGDSTCPVERSWLLQTACGLTGWTAPLELAHLVAAYDAAARWHADIVHDHTILGPVYAGHRTGVVAVATNHGPFDAHTTSIYRAVAAHVAVIAISWSQAAKSDGVPIAAVIHHGIDPAAFPFGSGDGGYAVFLGRMSPDKGPHTAARLAREAGCPLRIAAKMREPLERRFFEDHVRPFLGGRVQFVGEVAGSAKSELLAGAMCLVNPIEWPEPFGIVMIESLASGTPVVAAPRGAAPEIVDHGRTGFLCGDDERFVAALHAAGRLDRRACRAAAESRFSLDRMVQEHLAVYERVLGAEEPPRAALTRRVVRSSA